MKRITWLTIILLASGVLYSDDTKEPGKRFYLSLKTANLALPWIDYGLTRILIDSGIAYEANPVAALYIDKPEIMVPMILISSIGFNLVTNWMWREDYKTMAIVFQAIRFVISAIVIGNSIVLMIKYK